MRLVLCLMASSGSAIACSCFLPSVADAKKDAEVVFQGTITEIKDSTVFFRVARKWKGQVSRVFTMPDARETGACRGFEPKLLSVGNDLLVYANRLPDSKDGAYFTSICTRTGLAKKAREDFGKLGRASPPEK